MISVNDPVASVVVCTLNRARLLDGCLRSLLADASTVFRELIVVDNGSSDETRAVVSEMAQLAAPAAIRYVNEPKQGQSHARNRGVNAARGEFVLFTDDDVHVGNGWADALVAAFRDPSVGACGGRIVTEWPPERPNWLDAVVGERLSLPDYGTVPLVFDGADLPIGANMAVRADVLSEYAPVFDRRLGHRATLTIGRDETYLLERIRARHTIVYRPDAIVWHRVLPARMDRGWIRRSHFQRGVGWARQHALQGEEPLSLGPRVARAVRTYRGARARRRRNDRSVPLTARALLEEFDSYAWAGVHIERLLGRWPVLGNWAAGHLA